MSTTSQAERPVSWTVARWVACLIAGLLNAVDLGFQGNGNLVLSGVLLGFILGLAWSVSLLFGAPAFASKFGASVRRAFYGAALLVFLGIFVTV